MLKYVALLLKKVIDIPVPSWDVTSKLSLAGNIKLFPARESLVSTFRLRTGKLLSFFTVYILP
jgi:hypothetical protein